MLADTSESVTIRDIVSAPIIVDAATNARRFATSGRVLQTSAAMTPVGSAERCSLRTSIAAHLRVLRIELLDRLAGGALSVFDLTLAAALLAEIATI